MKKLMTVLAVAACALLCACEKDGDEEIHFVCTVGYAAEGNYLDFPTAGGTLDCPVAVGYYTGDTVPDELKYLDPATLTVSVEGEGFSMADAGVMGNTRVVKITAAEDSAHVGKLVVRAAKGGKSQKFEFPMTRRTAD